jgi:hypothetical protein
MKKAISIIILLGMIVIMTSCGKKVILLQNYTSVDLEDVSVWVDIDGSVISIGTIKATQNSSEYEINKEADKLTIRYYTNNSTQQQQQFVLEGDTKNLPTYRIDYIFQYNSGSWSMEKKE